MWSRNQDHHNMNLHCCGNLKSSIFIKLFSALFSPSILCIVIASASLAVSVSGIRELYWH
jgi:hypothetical protein